MAVYCASLERTVGYWDTGEAQVVPWIFGIMHATGFPAFTLLAGAFAHLFPFESVAMRIALFSALAMSGAAWLVAKTVVELDGEPWLACASGWIFAFGSIAWTRGTRAEVHALGVFFAAATLYAALRWYRTGNPTALVAAAFAWGLGIATHPIVALLMPALLVLFLARLRATAYRTIALAASALIFGVAWYGYLPARSAAVTAARLDPTLALGLPAGTAFWDNDHPASWDGFVKEISGTQFSAGGALGGMLSLSTYTAGLPKFGLTLLSEITPVALLAACGGVVALWRRDRTLCVTLVAAFAVPSAFALSYTIEADPARYYLIGFAVAAILAGYGTSQLIRAMPRMRSATILCAILLGLGLVAVNRATFDQRSDPGAQAVIATVIQKTPRDAILLAPWIYATPLAYGAYVEHRLDQRIVDPAWLAEAASRVPVWMRTRPVYVVGTVFGNVPGYGTVKIAGSPDLYRLVRSPDSRPSSLHSWYRTFAPPRTTTTSCLPTPSCTDTHGSRGPARISMR